MDGVIRGRGRNKRFWTNEEDATLIAALLDLSRDPKWKGESGFKSGFMGKLEEMILKKLPHCGLKAEPHIDSRLKHWSEKYSAMAEMLGISGFGWDSEKKMLQVERSVYEEWIKTHKKAKGLYGVPFPHYEMLAEIYGKDRATGEASESFEKAVHDIDIEITRESLAIDIDEDFDIEAEIESGASGASSASGASDSRKRNSLRSQARVGKKLKGLTKKNDEVGNLASAIGSVSSSFEKVFQEMNSSLVAMAQAWTNEDERKKILDGESNKVLEEVLELDVLSPSDALEVATILMGEEHKLRIFFQANATLKKQYVSDILKRRNNWEFEVIMRLGLEK